MTMADVSAEVGPGTGRSVHVGVEDKNRMPLNGIETAVQVSRREGRQ
jgi:hypothetical protein